MSDNPASAVAAPTLSPAAPLPAQGAAGLPPRQGQGGYRPEPPGGRSTPPRPDRPRHGGESRKLVVGREISIQGTIQECDTLMVEGRVEADLTGASGLELAVTGSFKGSAEVDHAEIAGLFEGQITVHKSLKITRSGRIVGTVRYTLIEIEQGGQIQGQLEVMPRDTPPVTVPGAGPLA